MDNMSHKSLFDHAMSHLVHLLRARGLVLLCLGLLALTASSCKDEVVAADPKPLLSGPGTINFGDVPNGVCRDTVIRYDNTTGSVVTINSITFTDPSFTWMGVAFPFTLAIGASVDIHLQYCPSTVAPASSKMVVKGTGGSEVSITLSGNGVEPLLVEAKAGSTFTMEDVTFDSIGNETDRIVSVYSVLEDNVTIKGKTGVRSFISDGPDAAPMYVSYQQDGNVSLLLGEEAANWMFLPVQGGAGSSVVIFDTTIVQQGIPIRIKLEVTTSFVKTEDLTIKGETFGSSKIAVTITSTASALGQVKTEEHQNLLWWVPKLGYIGQQVNNNTDLNGSPQRTEGTVIDFNLVK
jgi:hypothetical protein